MRTLLKYTAQAARRREPTVGQEAVSTRSRKRRLVRSQWSPSRQGRLKTACCLSAKGVATAKQRFDRAVGTAGTPFSKYKNSSFFNEIKSHPLRGGVCPHRINIILAILKCEPSSSPSAELPCAWETIGRS